MTVPFMKKYTLGKEADNRPFMITVFGDASFKDGVSGGGYWFKSQAVSDKGHMKLRATESNHEAELEILLEAMRLAVAHIAHAGQPEAMLIVQSDSMAALGAMLLKTHAVAAKKSIPIPLRRKISSREGNLLALINREFGGRKIYLKHVKAHTSGTDARSSVNRHVDQMARHAMRK